MMDKVQSDWNILNDKKEIEIIEKYAHRMNVYTIILTRKRRKDIYEFFVVNYLISEIYIKSLSKRLHYFLTFHSILLYLLDCLYLY